MANTEPWLDLAEQARRSSDLSYAISLYEQAQLLAKTSNESATAAGYGLQIARLKKKLASGSPSTVSPEPPSAGVGESPEGTGNGDPDDDSFEDTAPTADDYDEDEVDGDADEGYYTEEAEYVEVSSTDPAPEVTAAPQEPPVNAPVNNEASAEPAPVVAAVQTPAVAPPPAEQAAEVEVKPRLLKRLAAFTANRCKTVASLLIKLSKQCFGLWKWLLLLVFGAWLSYAYTSVSKALSGSLAYPSRPPILLFLSLVLIILALRRKVVSQPAKDVLMLGLGALYLVWVVCFGLSVYLAQVFPSSKTVVAAASPQTPPPASTEAPAKETSAEPAAQSAMPEAPQLSTSGGPSDATEPLVAPPLTTDPQDAAPSGGPAPAWNPPATVQAAPSEAFFPSGLSEEWKKVDPNIVHVISQDNDASVIAFASFVANDLGRGKDGKPSFNPQELLLVRALAASAKCDTAKEEVLKIQNRLLGLYNGMSASPDGQLVGVPPDYVSGVQEILRLAGRRK